MRIERELDEHERSSSFDCRMCDGCGVLPVISVENGEPTIRYGTPCHGCPVGAKAREGGHGSQYPSREHLPFWQEFQNGKSGMKYHRWIEAKFEVMRWKKIKQEKVRRAVVRAKGGHHKKHGAPPAIGEVVKKVIEEAEGHAGQ